MSQGYYDANSGQVLYNTTSSLNTLPALAPQNLPSSMLPSQLLEARDMQPLYSAGAREVSSQSLDSQRASVPQYHRPFNLSQMINSPSQHDEPTQHFTTSGYQGNAAHTRFMPQPTPALLPETFLYNYKSPANPVNDNWGFDFGKMDGPSYGQHWS